MAEYYTTISMRQIGVLEYIAGKKIHMSASMIDYLKALAAQGHSLARDPSVEDFRKSISKCVGDALALRDRLHKLETDPSNAKTEDGEPDKAEKIKADYKNLENDIERAFRQICAIKTNKFLKKVKKELDEKPA